MSQYCLQLSLLQPGASNDVGLAGIRNVASQYCLQLSLLQPGIFTVVTNGGAVKVTILLAVITVATACKYY